MRLSDIKEKLISKADETYGKLEIDEKTEKLKSKVNYDENSVKVKEGFSKFKRNRKKIAAIVIVSILVFFIAVELVSVPVLYSMVLKKGGGEFLNRREVPQESTDWLKEVCGKELSDSDVFTESTDGVKLHGIYVKNKNFSGSYIIMCHPYGATAEYMAHYAKHYYDLGFNILLADARGHGKSGGDFIGMGWVDRFDIISWVSFLDEKDKDARIVIHGLGMGGAAALAASGEVLPDSVRVIINDSGYSSVNELFKFQLKENFSLPSFPILKLMAFYTEKKAGWSFDEADFLGAVQRSETPTLFIHGGCDERVPLKQGNVLYDACEAKKRQVVMTSANFGQCEQNSPDKYWGEIDRFLLNNLGQISGKN